MSQNDPAQRMFNRLSDKISDGLIQAVLGLLVMFIRPVATLTEIFFRKNMGERYFTYWNIMAGFIILSAAWCPLGLPEPQVGGFDHYGRYHVAVSATPKHVWIGITIFWFAALGFFSVIQYTMVRKRYAEKGRWHSMNIGIPWIPVIPVSVEKLLPIVAGILIMWFFQIFGFGLLLIVSSFISIMLRVYEAREFRNRVLDVIDGQIEQEYLAKVVMERTDPRDADGLQAPLPAYVSQKFREKFLETVAPTGGGSDVDLGAMNNLPDPTTE